MQINLFAPVELKDIRRNLNHWKGIANAMAKSYPNHMYAVVENMQGDYVCMPITPKFDRNIIYRAGGMSYGRNS